MTAISLLEQEGKAVRGSESTGDSPGVRSLQCCGSQSRKVLVLPFATLSRAVPVTFLLAKSKLWLSNNAIFKKGGGLMLAGSFCGLAKCMFPDLTQQSGKAC